MEPPPRTTFWRTSRRCSDKRETEIPPEPSPCKNGDGFFYVHQKCLQKGSKSFAFSRFPNTRLVRFFRNQGKPGSSVINDTLGILYPFQKERTATRKMRRHERRMHVLPVCVYAREGLRVRLLE